METRADEQVVTGTSARWSRLASFGFLMAALGVALMLFAGVAWGLDIGEDLVFFGGAIAVGLAACTLVRGRPTWMRVVAVVLGVFMALLVFWTVFGLFTPSSFFDFVPGLLVVPGILTGVGAGIAAIVAQRRGHTTQKAAGGERRALAVIPLAVLALAALSGVLTLAGRDSVDDSEADAVVRLSDFEFEEDAYRFEGGTTVLVKNDDPFFHTFNVDSLGIDVDLNPGSEKLVAIPDEPGEYVVYCEPHTGDEEEPADDDMATRLEVS